MVMQMGERQVNGSGPAGHAATAGLVIVLVMLASFAGSLAVMIQAPRVHYHVPPYHEGVARDMRMGTYIYDHSTVAARPEYMDDIARMVDRVLIDVMWGAVMTKNSSNAGCFNAAKYAFYDQFFQDLSARGLGIVIQFSPTRSPPSWLNVTFQMSDYRAVKPPQDPVERAFFKQELVAYVNHTVQFFHGKGYFVELEYCLADEPHDADWAEMLQAMHDTIKDVDPGYVVSLVLHKPELYPVFNDAFDMITIDPYNNDEEMVGKIRKAHDDVNNAKPVRVIISGMRDGPFDYQRVYRQLFISWFMGAHDLWFWSYNSRWDGRSNEWYVVLFSEDGPVHTERADAILNARQDLRILGDIEREVKTGTNATLHRLLLEKQHAAYVHVLRNDFPAARRELVAAHRLLAGA